MKFILLATVLVITAYAAPTDEWNQYKAEYNKVYTSEVQNMRRFKEYLKSKEMVEEHNRKYDRGETTYTMAINQFSDWFPEELNRLNGIQTKEFLSGGKPFELPPGIVVPDSINWVKKGAVTSVKDQGVCDCGYAFSAAGALEALMFIKNHTITDLSAQELVDCSRNNGCNGGTPFYSLWYVRESGIRSDKSYPYEASLGKCRAKGLEPIAGFPTILAILTEDNLQGAVAQVGPVSIRFADDKSFRHYKGGVFEGPCGDRQNHGMLVVGYGTDEETKTDYWLIKNSWGTKWGEDGYVRVIRNRNMCSLQSWAVVPFVP